MLALFSGKRPGVGDGEWVVIIMERYLKPAGRTRLQDESIDVRRGQASLEHPHYGERRGPENSVPEAASRPGPHGHPRLLC